MGFSSEKLIDELKRLFKLERREFFRIVGFGIVQGLLGLIVPVAVGNLINAVSFGGILQPVIILTIILISFLLAGASVRILQVWFIEILQRRLFARTALAASQAALNASTPAEREKMNYFIETFSLQKNLVSVLTDGTTALIAVLIGMVVIAVYHPYFIYFNIFLVLAAGYVVGYFLFKRGFGPSYAESDSKYRFLQRLQDAAIKRPGKARQGDETDFTALSRDYLQKRAGIFAIQFRQHVGMIAVYVLGNGIVLILGGYLVLQKEMSLGQLVAAEIIVSRMLETLSKFSKYFENFFNISDALLKLRALTSTSDSVQRDMPLPAETYPELLHPDWQALNLRWYFASAIATLLLILFLPWQQTSYGEGRVVAFSPTDRQQTIEAPVAGRIVHWHVHEGSLVKKGDALVTISDLDPQLTERLEQERFALTDRMRAARSRVDSVESRVTSLQLSRSEAMSAAENRVAMSSERVRQAQQTVTATEAALDTARANFERQKSLFEQGLTSQRNVELAELEFKRSKTEEQRAVAGLKSAEEEKKAMKRDANRIARDADAAINDARATMQSARSDLARSNEDLPRIEMRLSRQKTQEVVAPKDGIITRLLVSHEAEFVKEGKPLCILIPESGRRAVELWIDGNDITLLRDGREVRVMFQGWPALQISGWPQGAFGTFPAKVKFVDNADDGHGKFRVLLVPDEKAGEAWPDTALLRQGIRARGWVFLNRVSVGYELWRKFNDFPPEIPEDMRSKK
jgi:membrane fusion protein, adhesin transport system